MERFRAAVLAGHKGAAVGETVEVAVELLAPPPTKPRATRKAARRKSR